MDDNLPTAETIVYTDAWVLHLHPILEGKPPVWERLISSLSKTKRYETAQTIHNGRSGVSSTTYQNNVLLFGGVVDQELLHHKVDSTFYNDLSIFHVEKRKFIPIHIHDVKGKVGANALDSGAKASKSEEHDAIGDSVEALDMNLVLDDNEESVRKNMGWDIDKLRTNMFAFVDGNNNVIYEKIDSVLKTRNMEEVEATKKRIVDRTEPLPRINACVVMNGHTLYIYGGILEIGDREVTLDDMWCIDLRKNRTWHCIFPGTMHEQVWRGAAHDDDDSYYSTNTNSKEEDDIDAQEREAIESAVNSTSMTADKGNERLLGANEVNRAVLLSPKEEMIDLVERFNMNDDNHTPRPDETLSDFYIRTETYWKEQTNVVNDNESFIIAQKRFNELLPIMQRLKELKLLRKQEKSKQKQKS
jgi:hypothetical protein